MELRPNCNLSRKINIEIIYIKLLFISNVILFKIQRHSAHKFPNTNKSYNNNNLVKKGSLSSRLHTSSNIDRLSLTSTAF